MSLIILDIDETLIHSEWLLNDSLEENQYDFKFQLGDTDLDFSFFTLKRPYLNEFLDYVFSNFDVAIWTAASHDYATEILKKINIPLKNLKFFYSKNSCTLKLDYDTNKYYGVKNLSKISKKFDLNKVLIIDDIQKTAVNNYGNLIKIKPFENNLNDTELLKLISYLELIKNEPNYRRIEKRGWSN